MPYPKESPPTNSDYQTLKFDIAKELRTWNSQPDLETALYELRSSVLHHQVEFPLNCPILHFPKLKIGTNPRTNTPDLRVPKYQRFLTDISDPHERSGAIPVALSSVADYLSKRGVGSQCIIISPKGPDGLGGYLPETQIYIYQKTGSDGAVTGTTIRSNTSLEDCESIWSSHGNTSIPLNRGDIQARIFQISAVPITIDYSPLSIHQLLDLLESKSQHSYQSHREAASKASEIERIESLATINHIFHEFESEARKLGDQPNLLSAYIHSRLYRLILDVTRASSDQRKYHSDSQIASSAGGWIGCESDRVHNSTSTASGYEVYIDGHKYKLVFNCGACRADLGLYRKDSPRSGGGLLMKNGDRCPCCQGVYLGC